MRLRRGVVKFFIYLALALAVILAVMFSFLQSKGDELKQAAIPMYRDIAQQGWTVKAVQAHASPTLKAFMEQNDITPVLAVFKENGDILAFGRVIDFSVNCVKAYCLAEVEHRIRFQQGMRTVTTKLYKPADGKWMLQSFRLHPDVIQVRVQSKKAAPP